MYPLMPQPRFVCQHFIQHFSRRSASTVVDLTDPAQRSTRRSNGLTWEGMRFRKVKLEEARAKAKWKAENLLKGKTPRFVETDDPTNNQTSSRHTSAEMSRPAGRIRAGRARIPGPIAAAYLTTEKGATKDLKPSAPSRPHGHQKEENVDPEEVKPAHVTSDKAKTPTREHYNWYWETIPPTIMETVRADNFFNKNPTPPTLLRSIAYFREVPESDVPEVAFVGRSNVGKSSLLNAIVGANVKDLLARTSATRGFTKTMNFYAIHGPKTGVTLTKDKRGRDKITGLGLVLVDMPGYGEGSLSSWGDEIMKYIQARKQLRRVFVLLDAEHGIKDKDRSLLASLRLAGVSHQVILSKLDKLYIPEGKYASFGVKNQDKPGTNPKPKGTLEEIRKKMKGLKPQINPPVGGGALGEILACSSETMVDGKRLGLDHVRYAVMKAVGMEKGKRQKLK